jgi:geranylgeranyl transferase type-2 subunit alpha
MHGRVRKEKPPTESEIENDRKKSAMYNKLIDIVFACRHKKEHNATILDLTSKVLKSNPDVYSIWNFRREIFIEMHSASLGVSEAVPAVKVARDVSKEAITEELNLSTEAIKRNSKSYGAWYHRVWIVDRFEVDVDAELALCKEFLTYDQRNFHCWNYRRYLVSMANVPPSSEFAFSTDKISENFSNYSAFHHRSVFIKSLVLESNTQEDNQALFEEEFSIIENAIFTEPDDQSAWWYYHFLLKFTVQHLSLESQWLIDELTRQLETLNSLLEVEPASKWCMLAKVFLINELLGVAAGRSESDADWRAERLKMVADLSVLDPAHVNRYKYMQQGFE